MTKKAQKVEKIEGFDAVKRMTVSDEKKVAKMKLLKMLKEMKLEMMTVVVVVVAADHVRVSKQIESNEVAPCHERLYDCPSPCRQRGRHHGSCTR